ncbi:MAG: 23S rRNA (pseudouridine(1915)-N(3))-methyltransferase RlmH [Methanotrichaceae archaeon]
MIIRIIAVGKLRETYWQDGLADYTKRLQPFARVEIIEIPDIRIPEKASAADGAKVMAKEGDAILERLRRHTGIVVALDRHGRTPDSLELAGWLEKQMLDGRKEIAWIIGGPLGLAEKVMLRADLVLSFSRLTFPHQMMRIMLLEQIYRSFRIIHHEPYHK